MKPHNEPGLALGRHNERFRKNRFEQLSIMQQASNGPAQTEKLNEINVPTPASNAFQRLAIHTPHTPRPRLWVARGLKGRLPLARFVPCRSLWQ